MLNNFIIRPEQPGDHRAVEKLVRDAFWNVYRPGCHEHYLLHHLRKHPDFVQSLNFVMELDDKIIGQNVFVKSHIQSDDGRKLPVLAMGPICIAPAYARKGYGKTLLDATLAHAKAQGYGAVCLEGNHAFYSKSGFRYGYEYGLRYEGMPPDAKPDFFLCRELQTGYLDGISGVYGAPQVYDVDQSGFAAFDAAFPYREKLKLPGRIFD